MISPFVEPEWRTANPEDAEKRSGNAL